MSVFTVGALVGSVEGAATAVEGFAGLAAGVSTFGPLAISAAAAVVTARVFDRVWNANRREIPNVESRLQAQIANARTIASAIQSALNSYNAVETQILEKQTQINLIESQTLNIAGIASGLNRVLRNLTDQVIEWTSSLVIVRLAASDNAFYTTNKNDVDALIDDYTSTPSHQTSIEDVIDDLITALNAAVAFITAQYDTSIFKVTAMLNSAVISPVILDDSYLEISDEDRKRLLGILAGLGAIALSKVRTKTNSRRPGKRRRKGNRKKKKKVKPPKQIISASVNTRKVSRWIERVEFTFPTKKDLNSDDKGTLIFYLKNGGRVRFVRVKRGTFSVISQVFGTGYRVWSQFWKKRIVNRTVLSWFIKRINADDRRIGITEEINDKGVKYK